MFSDSLLLIILTETVGRAILARAGALLPRGIAVATINYRLSGDAVFPAQIQDCKAAVRFLRANAAKYNLDPDRIAVMGDSAGAHLAALLATTSDITIWDKPSMPNATVSSKVGALVALAPIISIFDGPAESITARLLGCASVGHVRTRSKR